LLCLKEKEILHEDGRAKAERLKHEKLGSNNKELNHYNKAQQKLQVNLFLIGINLKTGRNIRI
jgi:hypothetical protein